MKKKLFSLIMSASIILGVVPVSLANADELEVVSGYVYNLNYSLYDDYFAVIAVDTQGNSTEYEFADNVVINGQECSGFLDYRPIVKAGACAEITLLGGEVVKYDFDDEPNQYNEVLYDEETKSLDLSEIDIVGLPVYYCCDGVYMPAYLDNNHKYDIEVYDFGVKVIDMTALNYGVTLKNTFVFNGIHVDYKQNIGLRCTNYTVDDSMYNYIYDAIVVGEFYDSNMNLLSKKTSILHQNFANILFSGLENSTNKYTMKIWLADINNNQISPVYSFDYQTEHMPVLYGTLEEVYYSSAKKAVVIKVRDKYNKVSEYPCHENVSVNERMYSTKNEYLQVIKTGVFVKFAINNNLVEIMHFDDGTHMHFDDVQYSNNTIKVDVKFSNAMVEEEATVCIALYRGSNFLQCHTEKAKANVSYTFTDVPKVNAYYKVKVFCWSGFDKMIPLSFCKEMSILGR